MAPRRNNARLDSPAPAGQALDASLNVDAVPAHPDGSPSSGQANAADAAAQSSAQGAQQAPPQQPAQSADPLTGAHFLQGLQAIIDNANNNAATQAAANNTAQAAMAQAMQGMA